MCGPVGMLEEVRKARNEHAGASLHYECFRPTPYSCQQGFCGTCKVKVFAGQADHRGRIAVGGEMLVCVSRADGGRLVIDV